MPDQVSVPGPGFSRIEVKILVVWILFVPFYFVLIVFLTLGGTGAELPGKLVLAAIASAILGLIGIQLYPYPTRLDLSPERVVFRARVYATRKRWPELDPNIRAPVGLYWDAGGLVVWRYRWPFSSSPLRTGGAWLTPRQMRELLRYPSGVSWVVPEAVARVTAEGTVDRPTTPSSVINPPLDGPPGAGLKPRVQR